MKLDGRCAERMLFASVIGIDHVVAHFKMSGRAAPFVAVWMPLCPHPAEATGPVCPRPWCTHGVLWTVAIHPWLLSASGWKDEGAKEVLQGGPHAALGPLAE